MKMVAQRHFWRGAKTYEFRFSNNRRPTLRTPCGEERLAPTSKSLDKSVETADTSVRATNIFEAKNCRPMLRTPGGEEELAR
jgi:hypothetical protein